MDNINQEQMQMQTQDNQKQGQRNPKIEAESQQYATMLKALLHSRDTSKSVVDMLKGNPDQTVPLTALNVNKQGELMTEQSGRPVSKEAVLGASAYLIGDLIDIGNASGSFDKPVDNKEQVYNIMQKTMQTYVHEGIKDGSIDPIELQVNTEPLLNDEQRAIGTKIAEERGIPMQGTKDQVYQQRERALQMKMKTEQKSKASQVSQQNMSALRG